MFRRWLLSFLLLMVLVRIAQAEDEALKEYFHHEGPLAGTLKSDHPLPLYHAQANHLWNRLFAIFYIRPRSLPATNDHVALTRYEGGDVIEFLAWGKTAYWSSPELIAKAEPLIDEFLNHEGEKLIADPLKKVLLQHDIWAVYDHLCEQHIHQRGDRQTQIRRDRLSAKLARCVQKLALPRDDLLSLPDTYAASVQSGKFVSRHDFHPERNYLPFGLLTSPDEWVEVDFYQPNTHEDISDRFITLHARSFQGRSYYRIFYRFPEGRQQVVDYLKRLDETGIDWKQAASNGFIATRKDAPAIPVGTEVVLLQLMMSLDDQLQPVPTRIVESFQFRVFRNLDGGGEPHTNTGVGVNVLDYRLKRHRLFSDANDGGLEREPEEMPQYRVAIDGLKPSAPDWGFADKQVLFQQCTDCHMSRRLDRKGVASIPSIIHSGGFDAGAQMGVVHAIGPNDSPVRGERVAKFKRNHETLRRLWDHLGI